MQISQYTILKDMENPIIGSPQTWKIDKHLKRHIVCVESTPIQKPNFHFVNIEWEVPFSQIQFTFVL